MMGSFSSKGAFEPAELDALKEIFDELTTQSWFDPSDQARESFATYLFETFPAATIDPRKHKSIVEASARIFFTREGVK
jgi:hypothetical protein